MLGRPPDERDKWLEGCQQEINNFNKRQVWEIINKTDVPANRKLIGNKWVFKRKRITMEHRSRLVALGYTQIPGLDFTDNFSPVVGDVTLRISLIVWIVLDLDIDQMDVETAFLEGILTPEEYVYMKCPTGMTLEETKCLLVKKGMYGLTQASRIFWIQFSAYLISDYVGFERCESDQCLFYKMGQYGPIILLLYVDDSAIMGDKRDITETIRLIGQKYKIKTEGELNDFLGCEILRRQREATCWLLQPHLIKKLQDKYKHVMTKFTKTCTPGTPRKIMHKCGETEILLDTEGHNEYRSGVGSLLYLLKHSRPEFSNPIRELSKPMSGPNEDHRKEMYRVISWILRTQHVGLKINPTWNKDYDGKIT